LVQYLSGIKKLSRKGLMEPNNQSVQKNSKRFPKWGWWLIGIIGAVILVGAGWWIATLRSTPQKSATNQNISATSSTTSSSTAIPVKPILAQYSGSKNIRDTKLLEPDTDGVNTKEIGLVKVAGPDKRDTMAVDGGMVYFINDEYTISSFDLTTGKTQKLEIGGIESHQEGDGSFNGAASMIIVNGKLYFLRGGCAETMKGCFMGVYDISTSKTTTIISNIESKVASKANSGLSLIENKGNSTVILWHSDGDGPYAGIDIYEINLNNNEMKKIDSVKYTDCDTEGINCTNKDKTSNEKFIKMYDYKFTCGKFAISQTHKLQGYDELSISIDSKETKNIRDVSYVGCVE